MNIETIPWVETEPGRIWRSLDGRYAIVVHTLPENPPRKVYQARKIDLATAEAYPKQGNLGILLEESPWCWNTENSVHSAQAIIERDAWRDAQGSNRHVPDDYPALGLEHFYWPISNGTTQAALAVVRENGKTLARVVGMSRGDANIYEPGIYAEIDLTELARETT